VRVVADSHAIFWYVQGSDPWDRFIVATARALALSLVTRDEHIGTARLVETIW
jgi:PIN domain nuclease of toxin-antitoxin system